VSHSRILLNILAARGITDPEAFLRPPTWQEVISPDSFPSMKALIDRVAVAKCYEETVAVFGDGDCDGVSSTAILTSSLSAIGVRPLVKIPHRDEGYGLSVEAVRSFSQAGVKLLICVDNGVNAVEALVLAHRLGIDTIVIDHHSRGDREFDRAITLWDPQFCASTLAMFAGWGIIERFRPSDVPAWRMSLNRLAALATIADCIPLVGQARILARIGMRDLGKVRNPGLQQLLRTAGVRGIPTSTQLAYSVIPVLNAAGRMATPMLALNMLIERNHERAGQKAEELAAINRERRSAQDACMSDLAKYDASHAAGVVLVSEKWPRGIAGIIAGRAVDLFQKPTIVLTPSAKPGLYTGSGRSIPGVSLVECLRACGEHLQQYGGHPMAVGLTLKQERIESFRQQFDTFVAQINRARPLPPAPEGELDLWDRTPGFLETMRAMEPFGEGHRPPRFLIRNLGVQALGAKSALFVDKRGNTLRAFTRNVEFGMGQKVDLICELTSDSATVVSVY
jgi:single-stranded-DNA-specific exonuclease